MKGRRPVIILTSVIVIFWLAMSFTLVKDRILPGLWFSDPDSLSTRALVQNWKDLKELNHIQYLSNQLGVSLMSIERTVDGEFDVNVVVKFSLKILTEIRIDWRSRLVLNEEFQIDRFRAIVDARGQSWDISGFATAENLYYKIKNNELETYGLMPLESPLSLREAVAPTLFKFQRLRVGDVFSIPVFDPLWNMDRGEMTLEVVSEEEVNMSDGNSLLAFRVETELGNIKNTLWIDEDGQVLKRRLMGDLIMERIPSTEWDKFTYLLERIEIPEMNEAEFVAGIGESTDAQKPGLAAFLDGKGFNDDDRD